MKQRQKPKLVDFYLSVVIVSSIILSVLALWALIRQYRLLNELVSTVPELSAEKYYWLASVGKIGIFTFSMVVVALVVILIISSYLSSRDMQRQMELTSLKNDFVSNVSHELKTPLTSIRLLAERLSHLEPGDREKQKEYYNLILSQSLRLSYLINNILDFAKLEKDGRIDYEFKNLDLNSVLQDSLSGYKAEYLNPGSHIEFIQQDNPLPVYGDKQALSRVVTNMLDNALKFSDKNCTVDIITGRLSDSEAFFEVKDRGCGIEEDDKEKVFDQFYHKGEKGTGLGLTLVKRIVDAHNGRIEVESAPGRGSIFRVALPVLDASRVQVS